MKYSVYQHWDPLRVCLVGRSYSPEFYHFIKNERVRTVMERIARETEEDYQKLITLLESFGVKILRPDLTDDYRDYMFGGGKIHPPPMTPRDYSCMLGKDFFFKTTDATEKWNVRRGADWPENMPTTQDEFLQFECADNIKKEIAEFLIAENVIPSLAEVFTVPPQYTIWSKVLNELSQHTNIITQSKIKSCDHLNSAGFTRVGKDIYLGTEYQDEDNSVKAAELSRNFSEYRWHSVNTGGHSDGTYCPVVPGLIVSLKDIQTYAETFPGWEVIYLPDQSWDKISPFLELKMKNSGKWWVPGEELNDDFTNFVEEWLGHWVGFVEETVFDVNMLVIDRHNVVCNNYNKEVFEAFERHGVTPHVINFRHRYFWDGGLHCITSDVHREGTMEDYFPDRG